MKKFIKIVLIIILILIVIYDLLFISLLLSRAKVRLTKIINIFLLVAVIFSVLCIIKASPKVRKIIITVEVLLLILYIVMTLTNIYLVKNNKPPKFYLYITPTCQCGSNTTHYNCLAYGVTSVTVDYVDGTQKIHWIIFSYKDYEIGTNIFPRYMSGYISDERLVELLEEHKNK